MVCLAEKNLISPEARALIETKVHTREGLRQLATLLPKDDTEMVRWIKAAAEQMDEGTAERLFYAAALAGRSLPASLLPQMMFFNSWFFRLGWVALRMTGNIAEELLRGLENAVASAQNRAGVLLTAAAWWKEHRPSRGPAGSGVG